MTLDFFRGAHTHMHIHHTYVHTHEEGKEKSVCSLVSQQQKMCICDRETDNIFLCWSF